MSTETSILFIWLVLIQEGAAIRPAVTFTPDYKKIFTTEQITMTCDGGSTIGEGMDYIWYRDSKQVYNGQSYTIQRARTSHSGSYQCQTRPGEISDPARLDVSNGYVILQTPLYVYEGDDIYMRCHHYPRYYGRQTRFYKDNNVIRDWSDNGDYYIRNVTKTTSGTYGCRKEVHHHGLYYQHRDDIFVSVQEPFSLPKITLINNSKIEGKPLTLSCDVTISPYIKPTELQFAFYKDEQTVQGFSSSDKYEVQSAQLEDSGNYMCEAKTSTNNSTRRSHGVYIDIQELFTTPTINVMPNPVSKADNMTLTCQTSLPPPPRHNTQLRIAFYREGGIVQGFGVSDTYEVYNVQLEDSGKYSCEVETTDGRVRKRSAERIIQIEELFPIPRTKVTITPIFEKNIMTLTCQTSLPSPRHNTQLRIAFYREGGIVQGFGVSDTYEVYNVQLEDSGKYSCEVETTDGRVRKRSAEQIIQIEGFFSQPKMIMTNSVVVEGDPMTLTCDTTLGPTIKPTEVQFAFYRDGQKVQGFTSSNKYEARSAQIEDSGNYTCEIKNVIDTVVRRSHGYYIRIEELFSIPTISVTPNSVSMGDNMTLTCQTRLHPSRQNIQLWFTFYREGGIVQGFGVSDNYKIYSVQMEDCGKFSCQVSTSEGRAMKRSAEQVIQLDGNIRYTRQNIIRLTLSTCVLIAAALFAFHHIKWMKSMEPATVQDPKAMSTHVPTAEAVHTNLHLEPMTDNCVNYVNITDNTMQM
ncbi:Fc receptor-like protein 5 [Leptodactylus fuscus]|uniref:Fc receptor-like protein 5 n=1 Tax=Leptodactylus fuscus TaxID=238119 RepID=UPI003F4EB50A